MYISGLQMLCDDDEATNCFLSVSKLGQLKIYENTLATAMATVNFSALVGDRRGICP